MTGTSFAHTQVAVVVFPGSNCERDTLLALRQLGADARLVWHGDTAASDSFLAEADAYVVPGGFSYGDYLRPGAIARFSPAMDTLVEAAGRGVPVLGICNGFQVLTEAGLLPGALRPNQGLRFVCAPAQLIVASTANAVGAQLDVGQAITLPINHFEGNYTVGSQVLDEIVANDQVVLRYAANPNGSADDIAGVSNLLGNVVGLMPHPERAMGALFGSSDGTRLLGGLLSYATARQQGDQGAALVASS